LSICKFLSIACRTISASKTLASHLFRRRIRASYVYNGCLAWYNVVLYHSGQLYNKHVNILSLPISFSAHAKRFARRQSLLWLMFEVVHATGSRCGDRVLGLVSPALGSDGVLEHQFVPVDGRRRAQRLPVCRTQRNNAR